MERKRQKNYGTLLLSEIRRKQNNPLSKQKKGTFTQKISPFQNTTKKLKPLENTTKIFENYQLN